MRSCVVLDTRGATPNPGGEATQTVLGPLLGLQLVGLVGVRVAYDRMSVFYYTPGSTCRSLFCTCRSLF